MNIAQIALSLGGKFLGDVATAASIEVHSPVCAAPHTVPGSIFVAIRGISRDGHDFIAQAKESGSKAFIVEDPTKVPAGEIGIVVSDTRRVWSKVCALFSNFPSDKMTVIGVTGTNGKTTTNGLIYDALTALGTKCLRMGTIGSFSPGVINDPDTLTSPDAQYLHATMQKAYAAGVTHCMMETSSHALAQFRVEDVSFDLGIFTNLTRDHLDFHRTMEEYEKAKSHLFELLAQSNKKRPGAILHSDDPAGERYLTLCKKLKIETISFGRKPQCDIQIGEHQQDISGSAITLNIYGKDHVMKTPLIGAHNAENLAGALGALIHLGIEPQRAIAVLGEVPPVSGRLEPISGSDIGCYVDYAHTPDALERAIAAVRPLCKQGNKLWVLFGCGGDRDRGKRPIMGDIAMRFADKVVVTSDNPRTEDPEQIVKDILNSSCKPAIVDLDRSAAIIKTITEASPGDVVLLAGKGHEDYQIIGKVKHHLSDQEIAREAITHRAKK
jgi:UDP-N-acetylmuramoyl-L-alanyl-D-glutamate--2,6-diaminopimelate ligase